MIKIIITLLEFLIPILTCILLMKNKNVKEKTQQIYDKTVINLTSKLKEKTHGRFSYIEIDNNLKKKGAYYMFQEHMNPAVYIMIKIFSSLLLLLAGLSLSKNILIAIAIGVLGFFLFDILLKISNNNDNDDMLSDIKDMVDILKIQTNAGVHISKSLDTCYRTVENKRLKYELLELRNRLILTNDIENSIRLFNKRFDNEYIDMMCVMVLQSQESGYSLQIMKDMSTQISDLQKAINIKKQETLDRKIQLLELLVFVGLLGTCIYAMALELSKALSQM